MSDRLAASRDMLGIPTLTDAIVLRREAREAQRQYLADPTTANRQTYTAALWRSLLRAFAANLSQ